jgi:hypothetical protein
MGAMKFLFLLYAKANNLENYFNYKKKLIKFQSNTTDILNQMLGKHVSDKLTNPSSGLVYKINSK